MNRKSLQDNFFILFCKHHTFNHPQTTQTLDSQDKCLLSNNILDYHVVSQGKTTIPSVDDAEEMNVTDVRPRKQPLTVPSIKTNPRVNRFCRIFLPS